MPSATLKSEINRIHEGVIIVDHQWRITSINQIAAHMLQQKLPADLIGHDLREGLISSERENLLEAGMRATQEATPVAINAFSNTIDCWLEYRLYPMPAGLMITFSETTPSLPLVSNVDNQDLFIQTLADSNFISLGVIDWNACYTAVSQHHVLASSHNGERLIGRCVRELFPGYDEIWTEILENSSAGRITTTQPLKYQLPGGSVEWIKWHAYPWYEPDGVICGCGIIAEILTEQIDAITQLKKVTKDLAVLYMVSQKLQKFLSLEELSQEIIEILESFLEYTYSAVLLIDEVDGETLVPFALSTQRKGKRFLQKDKKYVRSKKLKVGIGITGWVAQHGKSQRIANVQNDARYFSMRNDIHSELCVPLFLQNRVIGVINIETTKENAYSMDDQLILETIAGQISVSIQNALFYEKLRQVFIEREKMQDVLIQNEKNATLGLLTASIAHEINNPLQSIKGFLSLFYQEVQEGHNEKTLDHYFNIIEEEIDRIVRLVRNMRDLYKPAAVHDPHSTDVNAVLKAVLTLMAKQLTNYDIELRTSLCHPLALVTANADHIKQLLINLVLNAIDAMKTGGTLFISTAVVNTDENQLMIEIKVSDSGHGMSQDVLDHLFSSVFTTKEHGSGLGLYISRDIVKSYGGTITVSSSLNVGTTFTVQMPAYFMEAER